MQSSCSSYMQYRGIGTATKKGTEVLGKHNNRNNSTTISVQSVSGSVEFLRAIIGHGFIVQNSEVQFPCHTTNPIRAVAIAAYSHAKPPFYLG